MTTMNEVKHTPGPWKVDDDTAHGRMTLIFDQLGDLIADTARGMRNVDLDSAASECEANARLIAAAPALLEALKELWPFIEADCDGANADLDDPYQAAMAKARAAIAQAEGGVA